MMNRLVVVLAVTMLVAGCSKPLTNARPAGASAAPAAAAPPPVMARTAPKLIWVPEWKLYVMEGYDIVYYDAAYYYFHNGYWWVSQAHTGPWAVMLVPPATIRKLPRDLHAHLPWGGPKKCPRGLATPGRC